MSSAWKLEQERTIMRRVKSMTGREPVGMLDLLRILASPDVVNLTRAYIDAPPDPVKPNAEDDTRFVPRA